MAAHAVVGREPELGRLRRFLGGATGGAVVLHGEPGIGKTALWHGGVDEAVAAGRRVLVHRAVEAEAGFGFTGLADLLAAALPAVEDSLAEPRRRALRVALLLEDAGGEPPLVPAIGLAVCDALRALSTERPVLVAIDDLQWLDSSSAAVLPIALRRLRDEPVAVLVTV